MSVQQAMLTAIYAIHIKYTSKHKTSLLNGIGKEQLYPNQFQTIKQLTVTLTLHFNALANNIPRLNCNSHCTVIKDLKSQYL